MLNPVKYMTEGCTKYGKSYFKVSTLQDEYTVVSEKDKIKEVCWNSHTYYSPVAYS
jgi:hypothetical protein